MSAIASIGHTAPVTGLQPPSEASESAAAERGESAVQEAAESGGAKGATAPGVGTKLDISA